MILFTKSQYFTFVELSRKSMQELIELLHSKKEALKTVDEEDEAGEIDLINECKDIENEMMRQKEQLSLKTSEELNEIQKNADRRIQQMENYEWDAVENSSPENQRGFLQAIDDLNLLCEAVSLELYRREYGVAKEPERTT